MPQHNITSWSHPDGKKIDHFTKVGPGCTWCPWLHEQKEVADELGWERYCVLWVDTILHQSSILQNVVVEAFSTTCVTAYIVCQHVYCTCWKHNTSFEYAVHPTSRCTGAQFITWVYAGWAWEQAGLGKVLEVRAGQLKVEVWAFWNMREVIVCQCMTIISHWTAKEKSSLPDISPDHGKQDIESAHNLAQHIQSSQGERGTPSYEAWGGQEVGLW